MQGLLESCSNSNFAAQAAAVRLMLEMSKHNVPMLIPRAVHTDCIGCTSAAAAVAGAPAAADADNAAAPDDSWLQVNYHPNHAN